MKNQPSELATVICAFAFVALLGAAFGANNLAKWDPRMAVKNALTDTNGVKWIDGRYLPIEGRAFGDTEHYYDRLPANVTANVNEGVRRMKHHTSGMQFRFVTDSKKIRFRWMPYNTDCYMDHMPSTGNSGIDVYRYDEKKGGWRYVRTGRLGKDLSKGGVLEIPWTPGTPCLVNLPLYNGVREFTLGIDNAANVNALPPRKSGIKNPVVFYGTSITHGGCCSRPGMAFPSIVGRDLDVPIVNLGFSGSGVMELEMSEHLARIDASCYVLDCLWNMGLKENPKRPGRSVEGNYEKFIRNLRAKRPNVPIVMAEACDVYCWGPNEKDRFIRRLYDKLVAEGWTDLVYLPKEGMYADDFEGTVDGCHPNDYGMMSMAKAFGRAVREALKLNDGEGGCEVVGPKVSVFAEQVVEHARRTGLSVGAAAEAFRAAGVEGFDCHYADTNVSALVSGGLKPVNFYGDVKFLGADGGEAQTKAFVAAALVHKVPQVMVLPDEFTGVDDAADFAKIVEGMKRFVRYAKEKGLVVTTEDYGYFRTHQNPCGHVSYLKRLLEAVPELMFTVDSGNLHILEGRDAILEITRAAAPRIRHVHLKDNAASAVPGKRGPYVTLGTGEIPNREIVRFVRNSGYRGWYTLENLTGDNLLEDVVRQIAMVRCWTTSSAEPRWSRVVKFDKPDKTPLIYGGWSRSIDAAADEYCIYLDIYYDNGSLVYGPRVSWRLGTHGWEEAKGVFLPLRPVKEVHAHAFLRKGTGWAEFRDIYIERREPFKGETLHPGIQSDLPHSNVEERLWDTLEGSRLVPHIEQTSNAESPKSPIPSGGSVVWTADSRRTVTPLTFPSAADGAIARIELAGRERESFQICVSTAADVEWKDGSLVVPELKTADGRTLKGTVDWQRIGYIPRRPGYFNHWSPHAPPSREKWIPDPLLSAAPYRVRPASTQGLWVTVTADPDAEPGEYSGELAVTEGGTVRGTVKLTARVRDFALPKTFGLRTAFALMDGVLRRQYGADRLRKMKTEAIDILLDHRLNPDDISRFKLPEMSDLLLARDRGMNSFNLLNVVPEPKNKNAVCVLYSTPEETGTDAFYESFKRRLDPFVAEIRKNGLIKYAYVYGFDEREQNYFAGIDAFWQKFRKDFPDIPLMTTAKMYQYLAEGKTNVEHLVTTDWYCPVTHRYKKDTSDRLRAAGKQVWWYTCCTPLPPYANMAGVDWPAADGRILLGNMTWLYRADGFLFWHVNNWKPTNPLLGEDDTYFPEWRALEVPISWSITGCAGDGVFLYPGKERILPSIRLALIRDGVEDYEWLQAAAAKHGRDVADAAIRATVTSLTEFERDVRKLGDARTRVGDLVEN